MNVRDKREIAIAVQKLKESYDANFYEVSQDYEEKEYLMEFFISTQPKQDKHRSSKVKVYSRREETCVTEDADKARKMEEWKRLMRERELITYGKYLQNRNYFDDFSDAEEIYPRAADSTPNHSKDLCLGIDRPTADSKIQDDAVKMEELKTCMQRKNSTTEKVIAQRKDSEKENVNQHLNEFHFLSLLKQDTEINGGNEFMPFKVKVYSRREDMVDIVDQQEAIQLEEWKTVIHPNNCTTVDTKMDSVLELESNWVSGREFDRISERQFHPTPESQSDRELDRELDRESDRKSDQKLDRESDRKSDSKSDQELDQKLDRESDKKSDRESDRESDQKLDRESDKKLDRESDQELDRKLDRESDRESDRKLDRESDQKSDQEPDQESDRKLDRESDRESDRKLDGESDRKSDRKSDEKSDQESDQESVCELGSCHSDESHESVAEVEKIICAVALTIKSGDQMETVSSENMGDTNEWWLVRQLDSGKIGYIPRNRVLIENDHQLSNTKFNDLPMELLDRILENSFLHWIMKFSPHQRDGNAIKTLATVDYFWFQRTTRPRFKQRIWRWLKEFYENNKKRSAIIRTNQNYLLEKIEPNDDLIAGMLSFNCITKEQSHLFHRRRSKRSKNAELLHFLKSFDETKFSNVVKCLRQTNQKTAARILENGGGVINVEVLQFGENRTASMNTNHLHTKLKDIRNRKKLRSRQTVKHLSQLKDNDLEILDSQLVRQTVVVWIWCRSKTAIENIQRLHKSDQLREIFFGLTDYKSLTTEIMQSTVINIDQNNFNRAVAKCPISINFIERINVGKHEILGVTKLRNKIYVVFDNSSSDTFIRIFEDQNLFRLEKTLKFDESKSVDYFESNVKENCIYLGDSIDNCIWKITREADDQYKLMKWLAIDDFDSLILSVSNNGNFLVVSDGPPILRIYGSKAELLRSIQLPKDIKQPIHAVETSVGNFIILHKWMEVEVAEDSDASEEEDDKWVISEVISDGQKVVRQFNPSNETLKLRDPECLAVDSDDRVFVVDRGNLRVIFLNSDLEWDRILFSTKKEEIEFDEGKDKDDDRVRDEECRRCSMCFDEEKKQLIVRAFLALGEGIIVYNLSQK